MKSVSFSEWLEGKRKSTNADVMGSRNRTLRDAWYRWESGESLPYPKSVPEIAKVIGVKPIEVACAIVGISQSALVLQPQNVFLKVMRLSLGFTLRDIATRGIPSRTWSSWENNDRIPKDSHSNIKKISEILGVGESTLISVLYPARVKATKVDRPRTPLRKGRLSVRQC